MLSRRGRLSYVYAVFVREALRRFVRRSGYDVLRSYSVRRARLLDHLGIKTVLDVGANAGQYGSDIRTHGYAGRLVSFEPQSNAYAKLAEVAASDSLWETHNLALGDSNGDAEMHVASDDVWSSMLPLDTNTSATQLKYVSTEIVPTTRLDSLDVLDGSPTWLKIDVQGVEMQVFSGAAKSFDQLVAVECEILLEPLYAGQPTVRELVDFFDNRAFSLAVIHTGEFRESGRTVWIDAIFVRDPHPSPSRTAPFEPKASSAEGH